MKASSQLGLRGPVAGPRTMLTQEALELVAARFRAMGDPLRLRILQQLKSGECSVSTLTENLRATQPNVSKHLRVLQDAGLLKRRQQGNNAYYAIEDPIVFQLCDMICSRLLDRLESQVGALKARIQG
jgi:DNA-binding transcriptional ArsR family regulator